ncbi:PQQ-dependent sugar dehydrogenase [Nocardiopsis coralliicola]
MPRNARTLRCGAVAAAAVFLVGACGGPGADGGGGAHGEERLAPPGEPETVADGLETPWSIAFLPDGSALVSERDTARVLRVQPDGSTEEAGRVDGVAPGGEGGLLGLAVPPTLGEDLEGEVYAYYTAAGENRIVRMPFTDSGGLQGGAGQQQTVVDGIPAAEFHNGGRIVFGPDGMLYAGTGDAGDPSRAQDPASLGGKVLRMTPEGDPPPDPALDGVVHSLGHRNVQGLAFDGDALLATEFGQDAYDEANIIEPGENYGWPEVEGEGGGAEFTDPIAVWTTDEASPSGAAVAADSLWVAALRGERLWRVPLTGAPDDPAGEPESLFEGDYGRLRDVATTPDGSLWIATSNTDGRGSPADDDDKILRVPLED